MLPKCLNLVICLTVWGVNYLMTSWLSTTRTATKCLSFSFTSETSFRNFLSRLLSYESTKLIISETLIKNLMNSAKNICFEVQNSWLNRIRVLKALKVDQKLLMCRSISFGAPIREPIRKPLCVCINANICSKVMNHKQNLIINANINSQLVALSVCWSETRFSADKLLTSFWAINANIFLRVISVQIESVFF